MLTISDGARTVMMAKGRTAPRARYQRGWVEETGKRTRKWKGHYYTYEIMADGRERRVHRAVVLGLKSAMRKSDAVQRLQEIIDREANGLGGEHTKAVTLAWFVENRCFPIWRDNWKASHAARTEYVIRRYVVAPFADTALGDVDRFALQVRANELAKSSSRSIVRKFVTWARAVFEEAVEQGYLAKNPARRLTPPRDLREEKRRALSLGEVERLLGALDGRDALITRMYLVLGLRARELFALRRDDVEEKRIRVDESLDESNRFHAPKTQASRAWVWMPRDLAAEIAAWLEAMEDQRPEALLFTAGNGAPIRSENWRKRVLQTAAAELEMEGVTIHALRRTCATLLKREGDLKDVQAHLRHSRPEITAEVYLAETPESVRAAVEKLAARLAPE